MASNRPHNVVLVGLGWVGLGWVGLGWVGLGWLWWLVGCGVGWFKALQFSHSVAGGHMSRCLRTDAWILGSYQHHDLNRVEKIIL